MKWKKWVLLPLSFILLLLLFFAGNYYAKGFVASKGKPAIISNEKLHFKIKNLQVLLSGGNFNTTKCFLIDMSITSGKNRFFVYNIPGDSVESSSLVTHGRCNNTWLNGRRYSNTIGSGCTSLGRYKIGNSYQGKFGLAYKLYGLDSTNSNAYNRFVVLHSHECVPVNEVDPYPICQSDGCPTVSPVFLKELQKIIDKSKKPIVLYIFE